jgi:hypothetical protein
MRSRKRDTVRAERQSRPRQPSAHAAEAIGEVLVLRRAEEVRVLGVAGGLPVAGLQLERAQRAAHPGVDGVVVEAAVLVAVAEGREAVDAQRGRGDARAEAFLLPGQVRARAARAVAARLDAGAELRARGAAARDDVDDPADRLRAVQRGARALHDLDALDQFRGDVLQRRAPRGAGVHPHAVDQHERVVAVGAADERRRHLAGAAVARDLDAAVVAQQLGDVERVAALDRRAVDDHHGRQRLRGADRAARGGDDHVVQLHAVGEGGLKEQDGDRGCGRPRHA